MCARRLRGDLGCKGRFRLSSLLDNLDVVALVVELLDVAIVNVEVIHA
jgi:hypothetical protein